MGRAVTWFWEKQPIVEFDSDPPTEDVYETIFDTTKFVALSTITTRRLDDDADTKNVQLRVTVDNIITDVTLRSHADNTWYYWYLQPTDVEFTRSSTFYMAGYYTPFKGRGVEIELRQTDALGANAELDARIQYAIRKEV